MTKKILATSVVTAMMLTLVGCGGSSDSKTVATGTSFYIDSAVSGVNYKCGTQEGITGADGAFTFDVGTGCTFYLGDIKLRDVDTELLKDGENVYETDVKIARILQSLDSDGNADNGITIAAVTINALAEHDITTLPTTETALDTMLAVIVANGGSVISEVDAQAHLDETNLQELIVGKTFYMVIEGLRSADNLDSVYKTVFSEDGRKSTTEDGRTFEDTYMIEGNKVKISTPWNTFYEIISQNTEYIEINEVDDYESRVLRFYFDQAKAEAYIATLPAVDSLEALIIGKTFYLTDETETEVATLVFASDGTGTIGEFSFTYVISGESLIITGEDGGDTFTNVEELATHLRFTDANGNETGRFFFTHEAAAATLN